MQVGLNLWERLVRFGFRLLYNELAFTYDIVSVFVSMGAWRCWQRAALKNIHLPLTAHIIELAHGTGNLQLDLYAHGFTPVGYDLSPFMGRIALSKLRNHGLIPRLTRGTAQHLPFATEHFDAVICTFPTNFIFSPETLNEIYRILRPEGKLIIVISAVFVGNGLLKASLEWLYRITGQRNETSFHIADFFSAFGFDAEIMEEKCPGSIAQVIVARKSRTDA